MTGTLKARVGGAWVPIAGSGQEAAATARWNTAWGVVGSVGVFGGSVTTTTEAQIGSPITWTTVTGRRYRVSASALLATDVAGTTIGLRLKSAGSVTQRKQIAPAYANAGQGIDVVYEFDAGGVVAQSWTVHVGREAGSGQVWAYADGTCNTILIAEDIGPITPASIAPPTAGPRVVASGNALGIVAMGAMTNATHSVPANTAQNLTYPLAFIPAVGRRYRLVCRIRAVTWNGTAAGAYIGVNATGMTMYGDVWKVISGAHDSMDFEYIFEGNGAACTFQAAYQCNQPTTVYTDQATGHFYLEDVGPNTSPALPLPATPVAWTPVTFENGWGNFPGYTPAGYRKIGDEVQLRGCIRLGTINLAAFTLPVGFRIPYQMWFPVNSANAFASAIVGPNGAVLLNVNTAPDLSSIRFSTTA